jgi:hypothetical protein
MSVPSALVEDVAIETIKDPLEPAAEAPVLITRFPEVPLLVVPVENVSAPLIPNVPAFGVVITTDPVLVAVPRPDNRETNPPCAPVEDPPIIETKPPCAFPAAFPAAAPVFKDNMPDEPELVVPVINASVPLTPLVPALADLIVIDPEVFLFDDPALMLTLPPVLAVEPLLAPPETSTFPPEPEDVCEPVPPCNVRSPPAVDALVDPASILIKPPAPKAAEPTARVIAPPAPPVAAPVEKPRDPEVPALVVPVEKDNTPLIPEFPAFALDTTTLPLTLAPEPESNTASPPAADAEVPPATNDICPPIPVFPCPEES